MKDSIKLQITIDVDSLTGSSSFNKDAISLSFVDMNKNNDEVKGGEIKGSEIKDLNLSPRSTNSLIKAGINFKEQLESMEISSIKKIEGLGSKSLKELGELLGKDLLLKLGVGRPNAEKTIVSSDFDNFNLDNRTINCLENAGITSKGQLSSMSNQELRNLKGAGRKVWDAFEKIIGRSLYEVTGKVGRPKTKAEPVIVNVVAEPLAEPIVEPIFRPMVTPVQGKSIVDLNFSSRTINILSSLNILTLEQIKEMSIDEIRNIKGAGKKVIGEIEAVYGKKITASNEQKSSPVMVVDEAHKVSNGRGRPPKTIESANFKPRTLHALENNGIKFLKDLRAMTLDQVLNIKGLGKSSVEDILDKVVLAKVSTSTTESRKASRLKVGALPLTIRTSNALVSNGVKFVDQLEKLSDNEMVGMKGLGQTGIDQIHQAILKQA